MTAWDQPEAAGPPRGPSFGLAGDGRRPAQTATGATQTATGTPAAEATARWRPWHGRPRARDVLCVLGIVVSGLYSLATIPLTPVLIATHPVLLELLTGSTSSIVAAGSFSDVDSKLQLAVVIAAAVPGMMRFDWVFWWAGKLWGHRIIERLGQSPRATALTGMVERRGARFAAPLVAVSAFVPWGASAAVYAAAGWAGLALAPFLIADAIGTTLWAAVLAVAGHLLGRDGVTIANLISRYALVTICVLVVATAAPHVWHAWRRRSQAG